MSEYNAHTPRPYIAFAWAVISLGLIALVYCLSVFPPTIDVRLALIMAGAILSELFRLSLPVYALSLTYPLSMSAAVLGGPGAACLVSLVSSVSIDDIKSQKPVSVLVFNTGQLLVSSAAGALTYVAAGGRILLTTDGYVPLGVHDFPSALIGMVAAALASYGTNILLTCLGIALYRRVSLRNILVAGVRTAPSQVSLAFVGYLMAQVLAVSAFALPLFIFPLIIGREFYQRYVGLRDAYRDTIKSFVGALEAKDSYTRGHSVRVAAYSAQIGAEMRLAEDQLENLEYAALLHDLGKLSLPSEILIKPSKLSDDEMAAMRNHPFAGAKMVERIPPLRNLTPHVAAHHEWHDGNGYPLGVRGPDIPLNARILSVADAYDAMTTNRSYRAALSEEEAVQEIIDGSGSQFDPEIVKAFLSSREKLLTSRQTEFAESANAETAVVSVKEGRL